MKCPICGKELELRNKQIGTNENGDPVFNEYAICRDCKKQWNLDKQRAKRAAAKKAASDAGVQEKAPAPKAAPAQRVPVKDAVPSRKSPAKKEAPDQGTAAVNEASKQTASAEKKVPKKKAPVKKTSGETEAPVRKPAPKRRPRPETDLPEEPVRKPVRKKHPANEAQDEEKRYSNIPSEKVRTKREKAARKSYGDMLETGTIDKKAVKKKKAHSEDDTGEIRRSKDYKAENEKYDDDEYYDDDPRFRPMRIILGILSLAGFGYLIYRGFVTGLADTTEGGTVSTGMTYVILALCMLVSALLYFIMQSKNTIFAFLLPMLFYLGSAVFAFIQRGDDLQLLIAAIAGAVLAVISLILAVTSRGGYDDEDNEDYDDAFEDDYADDDED